LYGKISNNRDHKENPEIQELLGFPVCLEKTGSQGHPDLQVRVHIIIYNDREW